MSGKFYVHIPNTCSYVPLEPGCSIHLLDSLDPNLISYVKAELGENYFSTSDSSSISISNSDSSSSSSSSSSDDWFERSKAYYKSDEFKREYERECEKLNSITGDSYEKGIDYQEQEWRIQRQAYIRKHEPWKLYR